MGFCKIRFANFTSGWYGLIASVDWNESLTHKSSWHNKTSDDRSTHADP